MKKKGQIYEIIAAQIDEVSLVDRGANRKTFFLIKNYKGGKAMDEFKKAYDALFDSEPSEELMKVIDALDKKIQKEKTDALNVLAEIKDDFSDEAVIKSLETLICNIPVIVKEADPIEKPEVSKEAVEAMEKVISAANGLSKILGKKEIDIPVIETKSVTDGYVEVDLDVLEEKAIASAAAMVGPALAVLK